MQPLLAQLVLSSLGLSVVLLAASARAYPGGTWLDSNAPGHDFWRNFWCDLTSPIALNGESNRRGAQLAGAGLTFLSIGCALFWWALPLHLGTGTALALFLRITGGLSAVGLLTLPLVPTTRVGTYHAIAVFSAAVPAALAIAGALWGGGASGNSAVLGGAALLLGVADAGLYIVHLQQGGPPPVSLPVLQRLGSLVFLGWMASTVAPVAFR